MRNKVQIGVLERIGKKIIPVKYLTELDDYMDKAGIQVIPYKFLGSLFVATFPVALILYIFIILPYIEYNLLASIISLIVLFPALFALEILSLYFYLDLKIFNRVKEIEKHLDKFLQQVSDSLKGGMTFDKALWNSAKVEFGVLSEEIKTIAKRSTTGKDISGALKSFIEKYNSPTIKRTFILLEESIESGGKITGILDRVVNDLRETRKLNREMKTAVLNYIIFISLIVMAIAPGLFAVSGQLLQVLSKFIGTLSGSLTGAATPLAFSVSPVAITFSDFKIFSSLSLGVIGIFSAMIISIITKGDIKGGLKYIPVFITVSIILFHIFSAVLSAVFTGFI